MLRTCLLALLIVVSAGPLAPAQEWARKMFPETQHNFGTVARGAKTEYRFTVKNLYRDDLHISGVRTSCGCTTPSITKDTLKTYEEGAILAHFNTGTFQGQRGATITVTIDKPMRAEVQLRVDGLIRSDIVLNPGQVDLGMVDEGTPREQKIKVECAGRNAMQFTSVKCDCPFVEAQLSEPRREASRTTYDLTVRLLDTAPAGYLREQLMLVANDASKTQFPVEVEGRIEAGLAVSPNPLMVGALPMGQKITKQIVLKGKQPFRVMGISCDDPSFTFQPSDEAKSVHLIAVTFAAGNEPRKVSPKIRIQTDLEKSGLVELPVLGEVQSQAVQVGGP